MIEGPRIATTIECDPADSRMFSDAELAEIVAEVALAVMLVIGADSHSTTAGAAAGWERRGTSVRF